MYKKQDWQQLFKLLFIINLVLTISIPAKAEKINYPTNRRRNNTSQPVKKKPRNICKSNRRHRHCKPRKNVYFKQPQRQGTPQGTRPAGSRNACFVAAEEMPLTAIVPVTKRTEGRQLRWGLTTKEHPTFLFYVPHKLKSIKNAKFSLRNRQNQTIYETQLQLNDAPGVISVSLPPNTTSLEINKWYQYYLFVDTNCASNKSCKAVAQAWVKRENIQAQLDRISPRQRGLLYAKSGIWYDAMASFAKLKYAGGKNSEWVQMLESVGLGKIAKERVIDCCE